MNSVWLSLLWKEWCEFRWKLLALTASFVIGQGILMSIFTQDPWPDVWTAISQSMGFCLIIYLVLAGAFVGMSVAAGENSNRTMRFTQALPIPMWQAALARVLVATATVVIPIAVVVVLVWLFVNYVWDGPANFNELANFDNRRHSWGIHDFFISQGVASILGVTSLLWWVAACGVNRTDEVRAGAVAFLVSALLWFVLFYVMEEDILFLRYAMETVSVALPSGPAYSANFGYRPLDKSIPLLAIIAFVSHALVLAFFLTRYGRSTGRAYTGGKQFLTDWFRFRGPSQPFRTQSMAIIWKQVRELGPLALMAVTGILAFIAFTYVSDDPNRWSRHDWSSLLGGLTLVVAGFVTVVSGIGMIYEDYSRGLPNFWRSRPINLHQWFFLKYVAGVLVLVVAFGPLLLIAAKLKDWRMVEREDVVMITLVFLALYAGSLAAYALVRQPIYAVVLTIAGLWFTPIILFTVQKLFPFWEYNDERFMYLLLSFEVVFATILAWQAVVRNWGWKRHR
jgi:hypothetical protein